MAETPNRIEHLRDRNGHAFRILDIPAQRAYAARVKRSLDTQGVEKVEELYQEYEDLSAEHYYSYYQRGPVSRPSCVGLFTQIHDFLDLYISYIKPSYRLRSEEDRRDALANPFLLFDKLRAESLDFHKLDTRIDGVRIDFSEQLEREYLGPRGLFSDPESCPDAPAPEAILIDDESDQEQARGGEDLGTSSRATSASPVAGPSRLPFSPVGSNTQVAARESSSSASDIVMGTLGSGSESEEEMSEKRKGKRRALSEHVEPVTESVESVSPALPMSRSTFPKLSNPKPARYSEGTEVARNYRGVVQTVKAKKNSKASKEEATRRIKRNIPRTAYRRSIPEPEPDNDASESRLYQELFKREPPPSRKQGATFALIDFRVVLAEDESRKVNFLRLLKDGSKREIVVLGKVRVVEGMGKKDVSEEGDGENGEESPNETRREQVRTKEEGRGLEQDERPRSEEDRTPFVRLVGGIDFKGSVTVNSKGFQLETRLSTYQFTTPEQDYLESAFLDGAVELVNLWSLVWWEGAGAKDVAELAPLAIDLLRRAVETSDEREALFAEWQDDLPTWSRVKVRTLCRMDQPMQKNTRRWGFSEDVIDLLLATLPRLPFVTPEVYKLVYRYFPPKSFRTLNREEVETEHRQEVLQEERFLSSVRERVHRHRAKKRVKVDFFEEQKARCHPETATFPDVRCDIYHGAVLDGTEYRQGDAVVVIGKNEEPWIARIVYFLSFVNDKSGAIETRIHVEWFATSDLIPSLDPVLSPRQLFRLHGRCDTITPSVVAGKIRVHQLETGSTPPRDGYFTRFLYSVQEGSFVSTPPDYDEVPTSERAPLCDENEIYSCRSCEEQLRLELSTTSVERSTVKIFRPVLSSSESFEFANEIYHFGDFVLLEPNDPDQAPPGYDVKARIPLRLARLLSVTHGDKDGNPDVDDRQLGWDATINVEWIYRREELGTFDPHGRVYGREVLLSDIQEEGIAARRLRGKFRLEHVEVVNSLALHPIDAHSKFASDPLAFWTQFRLTHPASTIVGKLPENADSVRSRARMADVSVEEVSELQCVACRRAYAGEVAEEKAVLEASCLSVELSNLALYGGAGFLDLGLQAGCPIMAMSHAIEKNEAAAEILRNTHDVSPDKVVCEAVADVLERQYLGGSVPFSPGSIFAISGGSPCQGFSGANRHRRLDDVRTFEPFVWLSSLALYRPLSAFFENVARFCEHALPTAFPQDVPISGSFRKLFLSVLVELGYQVRWGIYQAAEFGVPQSRRRFIVQAALPPIPLPRAPRPTTAYKPEKPIDHSLVDSEKGIAVEQLTLGGPHRAVTVIDLSSDLPQFEVDPALSIPAGFDWNEQGGPEYLSELPLNDFQAKLRIDPLQRDFVISKVVTQHVCSAVNAEMAQRLRGLGSESKGQKGNHEDLKDFDCYPVQPPFVSGNPKLQPDWYRRLRPREVLATLRTSLNLDGVSHGSRIHYSQARALSVREMMRAQGVPDTVELFFAGLGREPTFVEVYRVIGNGVPVPLAEAFGRELFKTLIPISSRYLKSKPEFEENLWATIWKENVPRTLRAHSLRRSIAPSEGVASSSSVERLSSPLPERNCSTSTRVDDRRQPRSLTSVTTPEPTQAADTVSEQLNDSDTSDDDLVIVSVIGRSR